MSFHGLIAHFFLVLTYILCFSLFVLFCFCFSVRGPLTAVASPVAEHRLQTRRLSRHGSRAQPLRGMGDFLGPGHEPVFPASAGGCSTIPPRGVCMYVCMYVCIYLFIFAVRGPLTVVASPVGGAQAPDAQAQRPWLTGPAAPWHVGSSRTGARTRVPCIGRRTLNHCATREAQKCHVFC